MTDVSASFPGALKAERKGTNTLILRTLPHPIKRFDGKQAQYELEYRWHLRDDSPLTSVQGNEFTYWRPCEIREALAGKSLFDCFQLF